MKNKTLKNLIALSFFAVSIFSVSFGYVSASVYYDSPVYNGSNMDYYGNNYTPRQQIVEQQSRFEQYRLQLENQVSQQQYFNDQQKIIQEQNLALQKQGLAVNYIQPSTTQYVVAQPTTTTVKYVPQQKTVEYVPQQKINYVPASTQGASAYNSIKGTTTNTGKYVNYDANMQAANVYGYNNGQLVGQAYDPNGVTALSLNGSGGFLPTSVFQWFMLILLILAIVIVARMIAKRAAANNNPHGAVAH